MENQIYNILNDMAEFLNVMQMKKLQKVSKKFEKGIDRRTGLRYNNRAVSASETPSGQR